MEPPTTPTLPQGPIRSAHLWTWSAIGSSIAVGVVITWLHFAQVATYLRARQLLTDLREAQIDLGKGLLHVTSSDSPKSPFRAEVGFALLDQAIATLQDSELVLRNQFSDRKESERVALTVTQFRAELANYRTAREVGATGQTLLPLFLAFHALETEIHRVDLVSTLELEKERTRQNNRFAITLGISMALLGAMCCGAFVVGQRGATALAALHRSQQQLKDAHQFLSDLIEHCAALVFVKDREGRYELINRKWEEVTGIGRDRVLGNTDEQLFPGSVGARFMENDRRVLESGETVEVEETTGEGDGCRNFLSSKFPVLDSAGAIRGVCGVATEITERKRAETALQESQRRLNFALRAGHIRAWSVNLRDRTATRTLIQARIFGYENTEGDWSLDKFLGHVLPAERDGVQRRIQDGIATRTDWEIECRIRRTDGEVRWILIAGGVENTTADSPAFISGIIQDITEHKQAESQLRESDMRRALALDAAKAGTWEWDLGSGENRWSDEIWSLYGLPHHACEPSYEAWRETVHPQDRANLERTLQEAVQHESEILLEWRVNVPAGPERWLMSRGRPIRNDSGQVARYLGVVIDISERKHLEQERAAMEMQMRQQQKLESIGTLASGVAHEINNPITGIMNYAELIEDLLPKDSPLVEHTSEIKRETHRVATIVRNLLTFARNERQSHSPARVEDIIEAVLSLVRAVIRRDQIHLTVTVSPDLPALKCRSQQVQQVIMNLVTNSRDALNERYPESHPDKVMNLEARLVEKAGRRWIRISVEDHGTGIRPEVRERMFDPFFTTKGRDAGTGLGLAISHGIVKEHHGEWTVETEPGRFTHMHVDLPVDNGWEI